MQKITSEKHHLLNVLSTYYRPGAGEGARNKRTSKIAHIPVFMEPKVYWKRKILNSLTNKQLQSEKEYEGKSQSAIKISWERGV